MTTTPLSGRVIAGRFRLMERIGEGGMGVVYAAVQEPLGRPVVIKLIRSSSFGGPTDLELQRFGQEALMLSRFSHPHIVSLHDYGVDGDEVYIAMERLEGRTLADRLAQGPLPWRFALTRMRQVALALAEAHSLGIVHRDLKPANVFLVELQGLEAHVKVLDFGLARVQETQGKSLTQTGELIGTPGYLSPEQIDGAPATARSDLYSLGVMLHQCLSGKNPFSAETPVATLIRHLNSEAPPPSDSVPNLPARVDALVASLLVKDPSRRLASANDVILSIDELLGAAEHDDVTLRLPVQLSSPRKRARRTRIAGTVAALVLAACTFATLPSASRPVPPSLEPTSTQVIEPLPATSGASAEAALGRALFVEPLLSKTGRVSCRSCHSDETGTTTETRTRLGETGAWARYNTPSTLNAATLYRQTWSADVEELSEVIERPLTNPDLMGSSFALVVERLGSDPAWSKRFASAALPLSADGVKRALTAYLRSAVPTAAPYDRWLKGDAAAISANARRGAELFSAFGCTACHQGKAVGGNMVAVFGVMADPFVDRGLCPSGDYCRADSDCGNSSCAIPAPRSSDDNGAGTTSVARFRVPSLRNVSLTAPYFHDGSARTLAKAVEVMARVQLGRTLANDDVDAIVAFLQTLSGERMTPP